MLSRRGLSKAYGKRQLCGGDCSHAAFVHVKNTSEGSTVLEFEEGVDVEGWYLTFEQPPW